MDFNSEFDIARTAEFIKNRGFHRVALQFPDDLLKDSRRIVAALREELQSLSLCPPENLHEANLAQTFVQLYVMADTTYGNCCVDEVGASHVNAECVVHYGPTCLSPTSKLPAWFVFGKASINVKGCAESLFDCLSSSDKPILVIFGLEYEHAIGSVKEEMSLKSSALSGCSSKILYGEAKCSVMHPEKNSSTNSSSGQPEFVDCHDPCDSFEGCGSYSLGGLRWTLPHGGKMEDYLLFWIGPDNPAFGNIVLTYNACEIVRYDPMEDCLVKDKCHQKSILKRRYFLVEKAKDANIVGILVGTLGVAGYLHMIYHLKKLIEGAGKKSYTFAMGRPNPAKLANFAECDVFIFVACAQTAFLDSKEFLAPVITPYEAILAFNSVKQWTGEYVMEFQKLISSPLETINRVEEARFSFLQGGYVEDLERREGDQNKEKAIVLSEVAEKALKLEDRSPSSVFVKKEAKSGAEFFALRSYQGLELDREAPPVSSYVVGRKGKASGYEDEKKIGCT